MPAPLLDHRLVRPRQHPAERARADREKAEKQLAEIARRSDAFAQAASQPRRTLPIAIDTAACVGSTTGTPTASCKGFL